jgi:hypothetical protein
VTLNIALSVHNSTDSVCLNLAIVRMGQWQPTTRNPLERVPTFPAPNTHNRSARRCARSATAATIAMSPPRRKARSDAQISRDVRSISSL